MKNPNGFTLIELMVVISIIGILAAIAIPNFSTYRDRAFLCEGYELASPVRKDVIEYYDHMGVFPADNRVLGLPETIKGKYVKSITVKNGRIEIRYNENAGSYHQGVITLSPRLNNDDPTGPVAWDEARSFL